MLKRIGKIFLTLVLLLVLYEYACYVYTQPLMDEIEATMKGPEITWEELDKAPLIQRLFSPFNIGNSVVYVKKIERTLVFCGPGKGSVAIKQHLLYESAETVDYIRLNIERVNGNWEIVSYDWEP